MDQEHSLRSYIDLVEAKKTATPQQAWTVAFSTSFADSVTQTKRIFPDIQDKIERFVRTKLPNPISPEAKYGKHDSPMTGPLSGFYHCHLRDDAILIYRLRNRILYMVCIVSHAETEGKRGGKLAKSLKPHLLDGVLRDWIDLLK